jgi:hypothetical protein
LQSEHDHHKERVEQLYRRIFESKLGKMLQAIHNNHFRAPSMSEKTILEHQLKLS